MFRVYTCISGKSFFFKSQRLVTQCSTSCSNWDASMQNNGCKSTAIFSEPRESTGFREQRNIRFYRITVTTTAAPDGASLTAPLTAVIAVKQSALRRFYHRSDISVGCYARWARVVCGVMFAAANRTASRRHRLHARCAKNKPRGPAVFRYSRMNDLTNRDNAPRVPVYVYRFGTRPARRPFSRWRTGSNAPRREGYKSRDFEKYVQPSDTRTMSLLLGGQRGKIVLLLGRFFPQSDIWFTVHRGIFLVGSPSECWCWFVRFWDISCLFGLLILQYVLFLIFIFFW